MGWKTVIGCGQNANDTVDIGQQGPSITGGSYNPGTGVVTLTLSSTPANPWGAGVALNISGVTGTGTNISSVNGTFVAASGTSGTTVNYTISTGLTITTINAGGTLVYAGNNSSVPFTAYAPLGSSICTLSWEAPSPVGSYAIGQLNNHCPHTASGMTLTAGGSISTQLSANLVHQLVFGPTGSPTLGNQIAQFLAGTTYPSGQTIGDLSHSDAIPGGVPAALSQGWTGAAPGSGTMVYTGAFWQADQPGGACVPFNTGLGASTTGQNTDSTSSARYVGLTGGTHLNTTINVCQTSIPSAGTWSNIHMNVRANTAGTVGSATVRSCINSAFGGTNTGNQNCVIPFQFGPGISSEASGTDAVPAGSYINFQITDGINNANIAYSGVGSTWTSSQPNVTPLTAADQGANGGSGQFWRAQVGYMTLRMGQTGGGGTQGPGSIVPEGPCNVPTAGTFSQMNVVVATAGGASTAYSLVANAQGNQTISNPFGSTGVQLDASHTDSIPANTSFQYGYTGSGGGGVPTGVLVASQAVAFATPDGGGRLLMGGIG